MEMRTITEIDFREILDCMTGVDGGISFIKFRNFIEALDTRASNGDDDARQVIDIMTKFARLIRLAKIEG